MNQVKLHKVRRKSSGISLTPLIDVVFILLVFFMLASSFDQLRAVELTPPQKGTKELNPEDKRKVEIVVNAAHQYAIENQHYNLINVQKFMENKKDHSFIIKTSPSAGLQDLVSLMDIAASLSVTKISLSPQEDPK
jgi:biopolymer transport protein ExbD